jgi:two-component system chemotaxis sensor kinase CheA
LILARQLEDNPGGNMTPTQVEYATVIHASGNELLELLNGILDLAKVESGTVIAENAAVSIESLRNGLVREFEPVALGKNIGFSVDLAVDCPAMVVTDQQRLRQILKNLLSNAFKFTERGTVRVGIGLAGSGWSPETESLAHAAGVLALSVADTGIGIDPAQQQRVFEAFAQGDGTTARLYGGTGLGLSISRELVGLLGGELAVTSALGEGSTFTIYLPWEPTTRRSDAELLRASNPAVPAKDSYETVGQTIVPTPERPPSNGLEVSVIAGTKILLVDDDFRNIFALSALLERGHADVVVAESGSEALEILERIADVDVVLIDIMMPIMDGYETMRAIRSTEQFTELPIIAVTGKVVAGERQRCMDAGANDYVPKPVDQAELLAALRPWLPAPAQHTR